MGNKHEWGVVAQIHTPEYREFHHCCLCNKFVECGVERKFGVREFNKIASTTEMYYADSNERLYKWGLTAHDAKEE
jgi:hypothetical protein